MSAFATQGGHKHVRVIIYPCAGTSLLVRLLCVLSCWMISPT